MTPLEAVQLAIDSAKETESECRERGQFDSANFELEFIAGLEKALETLRSIIKEC